MLFIAPLALLATALPQLTPAPPTADPASPEAASAPLDLEAGLDPAPRVQDDDDEETPAERKRRLDREAKEAAKKLEEGLRSKERSERLASLAEAAQVVHPRVIDVIADVLGDDDPEVARRAIVHLGEMRHADALKALSRYAKRNDDELEDDPALEVLVVRAIGLHGDPKQIRWLAERALDAKDYDVRRMRVYAIARMRTPEALRATLDLMETTDVRRVKNRMRELRTALIWMTGTDQGDRPQAWFEWAREQGRALELPADPPQLVEEREREWYRAWGERPPERRQKKRGDRG